METIVPPHRALSPLQMIGIILIANTAVRAIANRPLPPIVQACAENVTATATAE